MSVRQNTIDQAFFLADASARLALTLQTAKYSPSKWRNVNASLRQYIADLKLSLTALGAFPNELGDRNGHLPCG